MRNLSALIALLSILFVLFSCSGEKPFPTPTMGGLYGTGTGIEKPFNEFPPDSSINVPRNVILSWQSFHYKGDSLSYDLFIHNSLEFNYDNVINVQSDTFYTRDSAIPLYPANSTFYWMVAATDQTGNVMFSDPWMFTTGELIDSPPDISILSPTQNDEFYLYNDISFLAEVTDVDDGLITGSAISWESSINGILGPGAQLNYSRLAPGEHSITVKATDISGGQSSKSISITVTDTLGANSAPVTTVTSPTFGQIFESDESILFSGTSTDPEDGTLSGNSLQWISSIDGLIGSGTPLNYTGLTVGEHFVTLRGIDSRYKFTDFQVKINIVDQINALPVATITSPANGAIITADLTLTLTGVALDEEDGGLTGTSIIWSSSIDGTLGTGESLSLTNMTVGKHIITMTARDSKNGIGSDQIELFITPIGNNNTPPIVSIVSPADGAAFILGSSVTFTGFADDPDETVPANEYEWFVDDLLSGTGNPYTISSLELGPHTIKLRANDSGGLYDSTSVEIYISAAGNSAPIARFKIMQIMPASPTSNIDISLDASIVYDAENAENELEVRWDFESDGSWDTPYSTSKTETIQYTSSGTSRFITMSVRDAGGFNDTVMLIVPEKVFVQSGNFFMGSDVGAPANELPKHITSIGNFYIDRYEVTNAQFAAFLSDNGNSDFFSSQMKIRLLADGSYAAIDGFENFPVVFVDWVAANTFANWYGQALPTEAEWEKAARGNIDSRIYPWGAGLTASHANYLIAGRPYESPAPVGIYNGQTINSYTTIDNSSIYGAYDMSGNVFEWVADWYSDAYYSTSPGTDPQGPATGEFKVYRGGAYDTDAPDMPLTRRFNAIPTARPYNVGFRCAFH